MSPFLMDYFELLFSFAKAKQKTDASFIFNCNFIISIYL